MKQNKSHYIQFNKLFINAGMSIMIILISSVSCSNEPLETLTNIPTKPLYNNFDIRKTSLQSGNLYYNAFLTTDGTWIYFQSDDGTSLVKSGFNGNYLRLVSRHFPSFINVVNKTVFFIEGTNSGKIYKVDTDGKGETLVVDVNAKSLIATQLYIFYIDTKDGFVYRSLHDGSENTLIFDHVTSIIQSADDFLYIFPADDSTGIYKISMDAVKTLSTVMVSPAATFKSTSASDTSGSVNASLSLIDFGLRTSEYKSINIQNNRYFYIDIKKNQIISVFENNRHRNFLETSVQSPFIISNNYIYYINQDDESRLYRVSSTKPSDNKMIVNDRVSQFVVCGNSIYYRRQNNLEIYRTPIEGGISQKVT